MKVILVKDVKDLGKKGQAVEVSEGYARNFLIPRGLVVLATDSAVRSMEQEKQAKDKRKEREQLGAKKLAEKMKDITLNITARAGEGGRIFGSVTSADIASALAKQGVKIDKRKIELKDPIKVVGTYEVSVRVYQEVVTKITVEVTGE